MGAHLVSLVLIRWAFVSDRAFRILVRMALTALDDESKGQPPCMYFGGRDLLSMTLAESEGSSRAVVHRTVARAIAELVEVGAIERSGKARAGQNQVYVLRLESIPNRSTKGVSGRHPQGVRSGHAEGVSGGPLRVSAADAPRNNEEPPKDLEGEEEAADLHTDLTVVGTETPSPTAKKLGCEKGCVRGYLLVGESLERCECNNIIPFPVREAS